MKCNDPKQFGELSFVINGFEYTLPNDDWVEKNTDDIAGQTENSQIGSSLTNIKTKYQQSLAQTDLGPSTMGGFIQELEEMSTAPQVTLTQNQGSNDKQKQQEMV